MQSLSRYITAVAVIFALSCTKDDHGIQYDPEEVVVKITITGHSFYPTAYVVLENKETDPVFQKLETGNSYTIKRGDSIRGETINLHFVYSLFDDVGNVSSYFSIAPGKEIHMTAGTGNHPKTCDGAEKSENNVVVEISFTDIPDFDIATRTAMYAGHCHTLSTLEVPCANIGGDKIPVGSPFYVCLQNGDNASYKLITMPNVSDYEISLAELNSNMVKYAIPKNPDFPKLIKVDAFGEAGRIGIFSLRTSDNNLFTGNTIDVFVPTGLPEMTTFNTTLSHYGENNSLKSSSYRNRAYVVTDYSFPDAELSLTPDRNPGDFPEITVSGNGYNYVSLRLLPSGEFSFHWDMNAPSFDDFYAVTFPAEVLKAMPGYYQNFFSHELYIGAEVHYDSRFTDYNDAVNLLMNISDMETNQEYDVKHARRWWNESDL